MRSCLHTLRYPRFIRHLGIKTRGDQILDAFGEWAERRPILAAWTRERFFAQAAKRLSIVGVDGAFGTQYLVRPGDRFIGRDLMVHGSFDAEKINAALAILSREGIGIRQLLDIGANIGTTSVEILRQRPEMTAVAFEPEPVNFALLRMNLIANGLDNRVQARQCAVSDETGSVSLEIADVNFGDHRVRLGDRTDDGPFGEAGRHVIDVPAVKLDDADVAIDDRTLLFMDVQGFEGHVLAGATEALNSRPPLVLEVWPYGLNRAGGQDLVLKGLACYTRFFDLNASSPTLLSHDDLGALMGSLNTSHLDSTDVLALK